MMLQKKQQKRLIIRSFILLARPKHWFKNLLIFVSILYAQNLTNIDRLLSVTLCFITFCFISSAVYIVNDIIDLEKDRNHPIKRNRPIASGQIQVRSAVIFAFILVTISLLLMLGWYENFYAALLVAVYTGLNLTYSLTLKHYEIIDCFCIAAGFVIRVYAGSFASGEPVSDWLFLTVVAMSLFMAFGKRRGELLKVATNGQRAVLENYNLAFLNGIMFACAGLSVAFYSLWAMSRGMNMIYTVPLVIFVICRYLLLIHDRNSHGDPTSVIFADKTLMTASAFYVVIVFCFLYAGDGI